MSAPDVPGPSRGLFDLWSTFYDLPLVQRLTYRPVQDAVVAALRTLAPRHVLDVGCGTGLLTARLGRELPGVSVVGCDFSRGMLAHARAHAGPVGWVQGDAQRLPFRDATADAIVSTEAFHWFPDQRRALAEFRRVLAPGGRLLVAFVNTPNDAVGTLFRVASRVMGQPFDWPTRAEMRALCERAGLRVEAQRRVFRFPAGLTLPPVLTIAMRPT
jgi:ubiquinone/menaquinone biosynthesis C-methylase UbiE